LRNSGFGVAAAFFLPELKPAPQQKPLEISKNILKQQQKASLFLNTAGIYICAYWSFVVLVYRRDICNPDADVCQSSTFTATNQFISL
jgi:hypothetical protein